MPLYRAHLRATSDALAVRYTSALCGVAYCAGRRRLLRATRDMHYNARTKARVTTSLRAAITAFQRATFLPSHYSISRVAAGSLRRLGIPFNRDRTSRGSSPSGSMLLGRYQDIKAHPVYD